MAARRISIDLGTRTISALNDVHDSGAGPGVLLLGNGDGFDACLAARTRLFAEEGYSVLCVDDGGALTPDNVAVVAAALRTNPATAGGISCVGFGDGGAVACRSAAAAGFKAVVVFDAMALLEDPGKIADLPCPVVLQYGTRDGDVKLSPLQTALDATDGSRIYGWPEAGAGFALDGHANFDRRVDSLAHSRTLELIRRVQGPYYDYAALFEQHVYHEFVTRDVDATMATMIDAPYVNHVATLAGGVGHDMLKRFYKYHFVDQNSSDRTSVTVSQTLGPDRVVLELVVRFKHDRVLDRYFPGIEPTGEYAELATVLIVKFRGDKVCHEHIYWDQGSALKQIGVLDAEGLPIAGPEAARKVLSETDPSNVFMQDAWATSDGKPL
ncbi:MAG: dienelactone hydrolase family protein [Alphaproteobacteria bacterium]